MVSAVSEPSQDEPETSTLKVNVTEDQRLRLHTMKILSGKNVSASVREALELYFERMAEDPDGEALLAQTEELIQQRS